MAVAPMSYEPKPGRAESVAAVHENHEDHQVLGLESELADLYTAILVVVPAALFLRWLCG